MHASQVYYIQLMEQEYDALTNYLHHLNLLDLKKMGNRMYYDWFMQVEKDLLETLMKTAKVRTSWENELKEQNVALFSGVTNTQILLGKLFEKIEGLNIRINQRRLTLLKQIKGLNPRFKNRKGNIDFLAKPLTLDITY